MTVAFILDFDGGTLDQYDAVVEDMQLGGKPAPGGIFHGAGLSAGSLRVLDVWEGDAPFEAFAQAKIGPITAAKGLPQPVIQRLEAAELSWGADPAAEAHFAQVVTIPGLDAEQFHAIDAKVRPDGTPPPGLICHVNGPVEGGWRVIDYWTSREARDAFGANTLGPVIQAAGLTQQPQFEDLDLHATMAEAPAAAGA
jgi:hypothetical protein